MLASSYAADGKYKEALETLKNIDTLYYRGFPILVKQLGRDEEGMKWCLKQFWKFEKSGITHERHYISILDQLSNQGDRKSLMRIYDRMKEKGMLKGNVEVMVNGTIINFFKQKGEMDICLGLLREMEKKGLIITEHIYNTILVGYRNKGELDKCEQLMKEMKEKNIKFGIYTYNALMEAYAEKGEVEECDRIMKEMEEENVEVDGHSLGPLIFGKAKGMDVHQALKIMKEMKEKKAVNIIVYTRMLDEYKKKGDLGSCEIIFKEVKKEGMKPDVVFYNLMIAAYAHKGDIEKCEEIKREMKENNLKKDIKTYTPMVVAYKKEEKMEECEALHEEMKNEGIEGDTQFYNLMLEGYIWRDWEKAVKYYNMIGEKGLKRDEITYTNIIFAASRNGKVRESEKYVERMVKEGMKMNPRVWQSLVLVYVRVGEIEKMKKVIKKMKEIKGEASLPNNTWALVVNFIGEGVSEREKDEIRTEVQGLEK